MSVYIKGMTMPKDCWHCELSVLYGERLWCRRMKEEVVRAKIDPSCPLVEVQTPHGRLIDADALIGKLHDECLFDYDARSVVYADIQEAPTIIPASMDGE